MNIKDFLSPNEGFQTSVNIAFDFGSDDKVKGLIPTDSVCRYVEVLLRDVISPSTQRAKLLVGPYGKGKSHITLAALTAMWEKDPSVFASLSNAYDSKALPFKASFDAFVEDGARLLPVIISGSSADLQHSLLYALKNSLRREGLDELMPKTNFNGVLEVLERWSDEYPETLAKFEELNDTTMASFASRLRNMDTSAYDEFVECYPQLTSGGAFDALSDANVIEVYESVLSSLKKRGINGIYVVYDEFSKFLEANIVSATVEDTKLLQDFAEKCSRSSQDAQLHLLLISHKSISNYIDDKLPKEKVDGWRGVSGRFSEIELVDDQNQAYELMSSAIVKDQTRWTEWLRLGEPSHDSLLSSIMQRTVRAGLIAPEIADMVIYGCHPLHPVSAFLLPKLSEKVAQNERTLFTFLCSYEDNSLAKAVENTEFFVSPDSIYDYFEPLMKKEYYASPIHKTYELSRISLSKVDCDSLEAKLIKTIALICIVASYDVLAPTRQTLIEVYEDCGFERLDVESAISNLVEKDSVVYLRQSNSLFKLKEASGVKVDVEVENRADLIRSKTSVSEILNSLQIARAQYPSEHNETRSIIRYFDCGFVSTGDLRNAINQSISRVIPGSGDGTLTAVFPETPEDMSDIEELAREFTTLSRMSIAIVPRQYSDVSETLFKLAAAKQLKDECGEDSVLAEEYEIIIEDYAEIANRYVEGFFRPEMKASKYFANGIKKSKISRKRKLSALMSAMCEESYPYTPRITSESLNKNKLTGTALHSRAKILNSLCAASLEPNLGFLGNGQETSMARSALSKTGILVDFETKPQLVIEGISDERIDRVFGVINAFIENASNDSFADLFEELTMPLDTKSGKGGIGLKQGPIPLLLACALRNYRDEITVSRDGEEKLFCSELIEDISQAPEKYELTRLNWSPDLSAYLRNLGDLFGSEKGGGRESVVDAIRMWYVTLPQVTRNSMVNHTEARLSADEMKKHTRFFSCIKRVDTDATKILLEEIPSIFGIKAGDPELVRAIEREKLFCDSFSESSIRALAKEIKGIFSPASHEDATLDSALKDWIETLPSNSNSIVFSGVNNLVFSAVKNSTPDDVATVGRIAKATTSLRVEDWSDARFKEFGNLLAPTKAEIEAACMREQTEETLCGSLSIQYINDAGEVCEKRFEQVECSKRARLLKNSIMSNIDEMGRSISPEEKRQVVFEILRSMC